MLQKNPKIIAANTFKLIQEFEGFYLVCGTWLALQMGIIVHTRKMPCGSKRKLYSLGLDRKEVDEIIALLINENYLNEELFAIQNAGGKFSIKALGKE